MFDIIKIIIHFLLGLWSEVVVLGGLIFLPISRLNFLSSLLIHLNHLGFLSLWFCKGGLLLLLSEFFFDNDLVFGFHCGGILDTVQLSFWNNNSIILLILDSLCTNASELIQSDDSSWSSDSSRCGDVSTSCSLGSGSFSEKWFVDVWLIVMGL